MLSIAFCYAVNRNHLALFHAVACAGGISAAASVVRISQPAISKQISELENALGVRLLERLPRGCRLTDAGALLYDYARRMHVLELEAEQALEEFRGLKRGRLRIGASQTIGAYLLPRVLSEFHSQYPKITLKVLTANSTQVQEALCAGTIDLGFTEGTTDAAGLESEEFYEDELVLIAPPGHPILRRGAVSAKALCREALLVREFGSGTREVLEQALAQRRLSFEPLLELSSPEAIKNAVVNGMGLAILSRLTVDLELRSGVLCQVPLSDLKLRRPLRRQWTRSRPQGPAEASFLTLLQKCLPPAG